MTLDCAQAAFCAYASTTSSAPTASSAVQPWTICKDISLGMEPQHPVPVVIDRPKTLLAAATGAGIEHSSHAAIPRVVPPRFLYVAGGYEHVTCKARNYLDRMYKPSGDGKPAPMWSGCAHTRVPAPAFDAFSANKSTRLVQRGGEQGALIVRDLWLNTPAVECVPNCTCQLRRCACGHMP